MPGTNNNWSFNPLALAELISGEPVPGEEWGDAQAVLEKVFQVEQELFFDTEGVEPPRMQFLQDLANALRDPQLLAHIVQLPAVRAVMNVYGWDTARIREIVPYLLPVADAIFNKPGAVAPGDAAVAGAYDDIGKYVVDNVSYLDPVQGNACDCYLISAMIALAWSRPAEWTKQVRSTVEQRGSSTIFQYAFYRGPEDLETAFAVAPRLPTDVHGRLAYARSPSTTGKRADTRRADRIEAWAPMFEKAFVMRECKCGSEDPSPSDYQLISDVRMEPQIACRTLAGGASHKDCSEVLSAVRHCCDARGVATLPTMAWTWATAGMMGELTWKKTGLFHNHCYAVLGIMPRKDRETTHVVLRNPWGKAPHRPDGHESGTWKPGAGPSGAPEVELKRNGVFAIRADWFTKCFPWVGWVDR